MPGLDSNTKLLIHCNGTDGQTTFTDVSSSPHTVTRIGTAQVDTAITDPWGGNDGVLMLDGDSDYLRIADSGDWNFGTNDFTIDFWMYSSSTTGAKFLWHHGPDIGNKYIGMYTDGDTYLNTDNVYTTTSPADKGPNSITSLNLVNAWHHVALVRNGNNWYWFVDGTDLLVDHSYPTVAFPEGGDINYTLAFGAAANSAYFFNGYMSEIRISNVARWTSNFTPPTEPYNDTPAPASRNQAIIIA
jgi:hypothetical protein